MFSKSGPLLILVAGLFAGYINCCTKKICISYYVNKIYLCLCHLIMRIYRCGLESSDFYCFFRIQWPHFSVNLRMVSFYVVSQGALLIARICVAIDVDRKVQIFIVFFLNTIITLFDAVYLCNICMVSYYVVSQAVLLIARILTHCPCSRILSRVSLFLRWFEWIGENSH